VGSSKNPVHGVIRAALAPVLRQQCKKPRTGGAFEGAGPVLGVFTGLA